MQMLHLKTFLIMGHLVGLTLGMGGATILDILLFRLVSRRKAVQKSDADVVDFVAKLVTWGLVALWITGIGFLVEYWYETPALLVNPKLYAKIAIVVILTINGIVLHAKVLPVLHRKVGQRLFDGPATQEQFVMLACGAISMISWYTPFILGIAKEMNKVVPASAILAVYAALVLAAAGSAQLGPVLLRWLERRQATPAVAAPAATLAAPPEEAPMFAALRARVAMELSNIDDQPALERIIAATQEARRAAPPRKAAAGHAPPARIERAA